MIFYLQNCRKLEDPSIALLFNKHTYFKNFNISGIGNISHKLITNISDQNLVQQKFYYSMLVDSKDIYGRQEPFKKERKFKLF